MTITASQSGNSVSSSEYRLRIDQLLQQVNLLEDDKHKLLKEKDEVQKQLMKQKDRTLEAEKDAGYAHPPLRTNARRFKSTLAALEGESGGQAKGETIQLQKTIRELTTEVKFKDAEIQKQKDVIPVYHPEPNDQLLRKQDQKLKESKAKLAKATAGADQSLRDELAELTKKSSIMKVVNLL